MELTPPLPSSPSFFLPTNEDNKKLEIKKRVNGKAQKMVEIKMIEKERNLIEMYVKCLRFH